MEASKRVTAALIIFAVCGCSREGNARQKNENVVAGPSVISLDSSAGDVLGVRVGMTEEQLIALSYPVFISSITEEGDEYRTIRVTLPEGVVIDTIFSSGTLHRFVVTSPKVRDRLDSGVGTTLGELRKKYPGGKLFIGYEGVKHANFVSGSKVIFRLDMNEIDERCFDDVAGSESCVGRDVTVESLVVDIAAN